MLFGRYSSTLIATLVPLIWDFHTQQALEFGKKKKIRVDRGRRRMVLPVQADRKATVTQIVALYIRGEQKSLSENTCQSFEVDGRQQQKPTSGFTRQSKQECLTTVGTCGSRLEILFSKPLQYNSHIMVHCDGPVLRVYHRP